MSQHFLLTAAARTVSLKQILRMKEAEAWTMFCSIRWPETDGAPVCPRCGCPTCWSCPRPNGAPRFRCSACRRDFSPTSGTLFAFHKLEIRDYLAAVVIFCDEVKGKAALALSRDLDVQDKTAFVLAHKIREAMASEVKSLRLGGSQRSLRLRLTPSAQGAALCERRRGGTLRSTAVMSVATSGLQTGRLIARTSVWRRTGAAGARSSW
jgi:transposase-like protein